MILLIGHQDFSAKFKNSMKMCICRNQDYTDPFFCGPAFTVAGWGHGPVFYEIYEFRILGYTDPFFIQKYEFSCFSWIEHQAFSEKVKDFDENDVFFVFRVTRTRFL